VARRDARVGEAAILKLVSEQRVVTVGQLARLLRTRPARARDRVARLVELGWVATGSFPGFEGEWVWLRSRGYVLLGVSGRYEPVRIRQLSHTHAITEARLALREEYPEGRWVCERELVRLRDRSGMVPDGVLELPGRRVAVEVEMSRKPLADLRSAVALRCEVYDEVLYFVAPRVKGPLEVVADRVGGAPVVIREIPAARRGFGGAAVDRRVFEPTAQELAALRIISEEGLVAVDQLGMLLGLNRGLGIVLAHRLEERNFVRREFAVGEDPGWLRLTARAARLAGTGLSCYVPSSPASVVERETLARVRAEWCARAGRRRWVTRRMLIVGRKGPRRADVPAAVAEAAAGSFAVLVVDRHTAAADRRRDLSLFSKSFDGVLCVAEEETIPWLRRYVEEAGIENVEIEEMP
jgi:hypothetical protein